VRRKKAEKKKKRWEIIILFLFFCIKNDDKKSELTNFAHCISKYSDCRVQVVVKLLSTSLNHVFHSYFGPGCLVLLRIKIIFGFTILFTREILLLCVNFFILFCRLKFLLKNNSKQTSFNEQRKSCCCSL